MMIRSPPRRPRPGAYAFSGGIVSAGGLHRQDGDRPAAARLRMGLDGDRRKLVRLAILQSRASKLFESVKAGLPVTDIAESFAKTRPMIRCCKSIRPWSMNRRAPPISSTPRVSGISCKIACIASRCWRVRARSIICRRACRGSRPSAPSRHSWACSARSGHHELVPGHRRLQQHQPRRVAPGIAEALFATALGLVAAIPA